MVQVTPFKVITGQWSGRGHVVIKVHTVRDQPPLVLDFEAKKAIAKEARLTLEDDNRRKIFW